MSNQLRAQLSSHVKNITNQQHLEWNHLANQSKALKWLPRHAVSKTAPAQSLCFENMASASRFLPLELPLDEFIEELSNKNTLSKTNRDVSLLKEFLRAKEVDKEIENLEAKELDEVLCAFIVEVKKKGRRRIRANNIEVVHFKLRPLFTKEGLSHNHHRRTGVQKNQRNTSCKAEGIEKGWQRKQVKSGPRSD